MHFTWCFGLVAKVAKKTTKRGGVLSILKSSEKCLHLLPFKDLYIYAIIFSTNTFKSVRKLTFEPAIWRGKISSSLATAGVKALKMALTFDSYNMVIILQIFWMLTYNVIVQSKLNTMRIIEGLLNQNF